MKEETVIYVLREKSKYLYIHIYKMHILYNIHNIYYYILIYIHIYYKYCTHIYVYIYIAEY